MSNAQCRTRELSTQTRARPVHRLSTHHPNTHTSKPKGTHGGRNTGRTAPVRNHGGGADAATDAHNKKPYARPARSDKPATAAVAAAPAPASSPSTSSSSARRARPDLPSVPGQLKVSATSQSKQVAGAISHTCRDGEAPSILAAGAPSVNTAVKAIAIARVNLADDKIELRCAPTLTDKISMGALRGRSR